MKKIRLDGFVGLDINTNDMAQNLIEAAGDDLEITVHSRGGFALDGLDIYQQIKEYPGKKTIRLGGIVASAATVIAAQKDAEIIADPSTVFMIHNAHGIAEGDFRAMAKTASRFREMNKHMSSLYADISGKTEEELLDMMNEETWLYGQEIVDAGFADRLSGEPQNTGKDQVIAIAKQKVEMAFQEAVAFAKQVKSQKVSDPEPTQEPEMELNRKIAADFIKENLSEKEIMNEFGIKIPADTSKEKDEKIAALEKEIKANAESVRQAAITAEFGVEEKTNLIREYVSNVTKGLVGDELKNAIEKIKTDDGVAKSLMAKQADSTSSVNAIGKSDKTNDKPNAIADGEVVEC